MTVSMMPAGRRSLRRALLAWYRKSARDLAWRRTRDPYRVWLSEIMLQQTRVDTVAPYYERFTERFPTLASLAEAELDDVLHAWAGLGYYSRARNLHAAARRVMNDCNGQVPDSVDRLRALPGIGRYTAGAIASIAFGRRAAVLDGNVKRVLARLYSIERSIDEAATLAALWNLSEELLPSRSPGDFNQALMELGARLCTARSPRCGVCPLRPHCAAAERGLAETLPVRSAKRPPREVSAAAAAIRLRGRFLLLQRPRRGSLGGLWEMPTVEASPGARRLDSRRVEAWVARNVGLAIRVEHALGVVRHAFTHKRIRLRVYSCSCDDNNVNLRTHSAARWLRPAEFERVALAALDRKALALLPRAGHGAIAQS